MQPFAPITRTLVLAGLLMLVSSACAKRQQARAPSAPVSATVGSVQTGVASWYGDPYHGRQAASGEVYDMEQLTAAHRTLPFQTWVEVTRLDNGKQVQVRINDRGPFIDGRIIDLSRAAAREIDLLRAGIAEVRMQVIEPPRVRSTTNPSSSPVADSRSTQANTNPTAIARPDTTAAGDSNPGAANLSAGGYTIQVGAFANRRSAESIRRRLPFFETRLKEMKRNVPGEPTLWRVLVGRGLSRDDALELAEEISLKTGEAFVIPDE